MNISYSLRTYRNIRHEAAVYGPIVILLYRGYTYLPCTGFFTKEDKCAKISIDKE